MTESKKRTFGQTVFLFLIFFLLSDFLIVRPLRNKVEKEQKIKNTQEEINMAKSIQSQTDIKGEDVYIENDYLKIKINTKGLLINDVELKKYKEKVDSDKNVKILKDTIEEFNRINIGWLSYTKDLIIPDNNSLWTYKKLDNLNIFSFDNKKGVVFKIILSLDDKYMLNIDQVIENNSNGRVFIRPFWQLEKYSLKEDITAFNGAIGYFDGELEDIKTKKLDKKNFEFNTFSWGGLTDKYWLTAFINNDPNGKINFLKDNAVVKVQYITKNNLVILEKSTVKTQNKIFIGAKDIEVLKEYKEKENLPLFDRSIDFGLFYIISRPMYGLLNFLNEITHNFGLAIILLTIIVKMILYPTTKKSLISAGKMKKAQPELKRIQNLYKNDKVKLQQEILKLYRKYEFNPLSSILPLLIQIPIFFSLYKVILINIYMRQAPFFGYLKDLSAGDPTTIFNLFGLLPFDVGYKVGLISCLMALTMYIQQKITESTANINDSEEMKTANNIIKYMPLLFLFMFAGFPSGLLLYWVSNNVITILQQLYINKKYVK